MISAQRFVEIWRQDHIGEPITQDGLAQMLVAYAEQFKIREEEIRADERQHRATGIMASYRQGVSEYRADLRARVVALRDQYNPFGSYEDAIDDVLALFGSPDE